MILDILAQLNAKRIVLASASPRRVDLLRSLGLKVEVIPSTFEENLDKKLFPKAEDYVKETALHKAKDVAQKLSEAGNAPDLVIGADTVVVQDGQILEKPADKEDAFRMLKSLSGRQHYVYTGVALVFNKKEQEPVIVSFSEGSAVEFAEMSDTLIREYIETGEPMDKAGAYGIQHSGAYGMIRRVEGCYFNVMGLPVHALCAQLKESHATGFFQ